LLVSFAAHSYNRAAIEKWLQSNKRSPITNTRLDSKDLLPNHALKRLIAGDEAALESLERLTANYFGNYTPVDVLVEVFMRLDIIALCRASRICTLWWSVASDDRVWEPRCSNIPEAKPATLSYKAWYGSHNRITPRQKKDAHTGTIHLVPASSEDM
jgi:F-box-like/U-box domain